MKKNYFLQLLIIFGFSTVVHSQIIFQEDFETTTVGTFPAGWTLFNVDGLTPATSVSNINNAWVVTDPESNGNNVATSTSWYSPAGVANDWMMTPAITLTYYNTLVWDAIATDPGFRDGYEVRISTTTPTIAASNTILLTVAEENITLTNRNIDLSAYAGQTVYISWRNNSNDMNRLLIDNISIGSLSTNVSITAGLNSGYTRIPLDQVVNLNSNAKISNIGTGAMTNVVTTLKVYDALTTLVHSETSAAITTLAAGNNQSIAFTAYTPTVAGTYTFTYEITTNETDSDLSNNTYSYTIEIQDTYARDNNIIAYAYGVGTGTGGRIGQEFEINNSTAISSVTFGIANTNGNLTGTTTYATIWNMVAGVPSTIVAQTVPTTITSTVNEFYNATIVGGNFTLAPGTYLVAIEEGANNMELLNTNSIFTPGTVWTSWVGQAWTNVETFGPGFEKTPIIRANFNELLSSVDNELDFNAIVLYPNPTKSYVKVLNNSQQSLIDATIYDISGRNVASYNLNNNLENNLDISKLSSGNYIVIIKSENGQVSKKLIIN